MEIQGRVLDLDFTNGGRLILVSKSKELAKVEEWETEYLKSADDFYHVVSSDERREVEKAKKVRTTVASHPFPDSSHACHGKFKCSSMRMQHCWEVHCEAVIQIMAPSSIVTARSAGSFLEYRL